MGRLHWRKKYPVHPSADVWPMGPDDELDNLREDIVENGLREAITFWEGEVAGRVECWLIAGRRRLEAMHRAGFRVLEGHKKYLDSNLDPLAYILDPLAYIMSENAHRRHMTKLAIAEAILAARKAAGVSDQVEPKLSKRGRAEGRKADPMKAAVLADAKSAGISPSTAKRAIAKSRGTDLTTIPKAHIDSLAALGVEDFTQNANHYKDCSFNNRRVGEVLYQ
jgi:hypothetical protein